MKVLKRVNDIEKSINPVVTIGTFDGLHIGHQKIVQHLMDKKKHYGGTSYLITFDPHPQKMLKNRSDSIQILTTLDEKIGFLSQYKLDYVLVLPFTHEISQMSGEQFIKDILIDKVGMVDIVIGYDHAFGYRRSGNIDTLQKYGKMYDFKVTVVEPLYINGQVVKSSKIRKLLQKGDVEIAGKMLGKYYQVRGNVVRGTGRGRRLMFPTANLETQNHKKLIPARGIYAAKIVVKENIYEGAVSIGIRPTFNEDQVFVEVHIVDFHEDIYGETVTIQFVKKLRDEKRFSSTDDLVAQMRIDVENAKSILNQQK